MASTANGTEQGTAPLHLSDQQDPALQRPKKRRPPSKDSPEIVGSTVRAAPHTIRASRDAAPSSTSLHSPSTTSAKTSVKAPTAAPDLEIVRHEQQGTISYPPVERTSPSLPILQKVSRVQNSEAKISRINDKIATDSNDSSKSPNPICAQEKKASVERKSARRVPEVEETSARLTEASRSSIRSEALPKKSRPSTESEDGQAAVRKRPMKTRPQVLSAETIGQSRSQERPSEAALTTKEVPKRPDRSFAEKAVVVEQFVQDSHSEANPPFPPTKRTKARTQDPTANRPQNPIVDDSLQPSNWKKATSKRLVSSHRSGELGSLSRDNPRTNGDKVPNVDKQFKPSSVQVTPPRRMEKSRNVKGRPSDVANDINVEETSNFLVQSPTPMSSRTAPDALSRSITEGATRTAPHAPRLQSKTDQPLSPSSRRGFSRTSRAHAEEGEEYTLRQQAQNGIESSQIQHQSLQSGKELQRPITRQITSGTNSNRTLSDTAQRAHVQPNRQPGERVRPTQSTRRPIPSQSPENTPQRARLVPRPQLEGNVATSRLTRNLDPGRPTDGAHQRPGLALAGRSAPFMDSTMNNPQRRPAHTTDRPGSENVAEVTLSRRPAQSAGVVGRYASVGSRTNANFRDIGNPGATRSLDRNTQRISSENVQQRRTAMVQDVPPQARSLPSPGRPMNTRSEGAPPIRARSPLHTREGGMGMNRNPMTARLPSSTALSSDAPPLRAHLSPRPNAGSGQMSQKPMIARPSSFAASNSAVPQVKANVNTGLRGLHGLKPGPPANVRGQAPARASLPSRRSGTDGIGGIGSVNTPAQGFNKGLANAVPSLPRSNRGMANQAGGKSMPGPSPYGGIQSTIPPKTLDRATNLGGIRNGINRLNPTTNGANLPHRMPHAQSRGQPLHGQRPARHAPPRQAHGGQGSRGHALAGQAHNGHVHAGHAHGGQSRGGHAHGGHPHASTHHGSQAHADRTHATHDPGSHAHDVHPGSRAHTDLPDPHDNIDIKDPNKPEHGDPGYSDPSQEHEHVKPQENSIADPNSTPEGPDPKPDPNNGNEPQDPQTAIIQDPSPPDKPDKPNTEDPSPSSNGIKKSEPTGDISQGQDPGHVRPPEDSTDMDHGQGDSDKNESSQNKSGEPAEAKADLERTMADFHADEKHDKTDYVSSKQNQDDLNTKEDRSTPDKDQMGSKNGLKLGLAAGAVAGGAVGAGLLASDMLDDSEPGDPPTGEASNTHDEEEVQNDTNHPNDSDSAVAQDFDGTPTGGDHAAQPADDYEPDVMDSRHDAHSLDTPDVDQDHNGRLSPATSSKANDDADERWDQSPHPDIERDSWDDSGMAHEDPHINDEQLYDSENGSFEGRDNFAAGDSQDEEGSIVGDDDEGELDGEFHERDSYSQDDGEWSHDEQPEYGEEETIEEENNQEEEEEEDGYVGEGVSQDDLNGEPEYGDEEAKELPNYDETGSQVGNDDDEYGGGMDDINEGEMDNHDDKTDDYGGDMDNINEGEMDNHDDETDDYGGDMDNINEGEMDNHDDETDDYGDNMDDNNGEMDDYGGDMGDNNGGTDDYGDNMGDNDGGTDDYGDNMGDNDGGTDDYGDNMGDNDGGTDDYGDNMGDNDGGMDDYGGDMGDNDGGMEDYSGDIDYSGGGMDDYGGSMDDYGGGIDDYGGGIDDYGGGMDDYGGSMDDYGGGMDDYGGGMDGCGGGDDNIVDYSAE